MVKGFSVLMVKFVYIEGNIRIIIKASRRDPGGQLLDLVSVEVNSVDGRPSMPASHLININDFT